MEIIMTVLITLLVVALIVAGINLVRLNRKAEELDTIQMDIEDISNRIDRMIENLERDLSQRVDDSNSDLLNRIDGWVASTDRRFDKTWNELKDITTSKKSY